MIKIIAFKYVNELQLFTQVLVLGSVLSVIVMYMTELMKKIIIISANKAWIFTVICLIISLIFGIAWSKTFANDTINTAYSLWLGMFLWLGSTGFYTKLEQSNGFWGKTVQSYSKYLEKWASADIPATTPTAPTTPTTPATPPETTPTTPTTPPAEQQYIYYTVVSGDTLWDIGIKYNVDYMQIASINNIQNPALIYPGMVLKIPVSSTDPNYIYYTVVSGDTLWDIGVRYNVDYREIAFVNNIENPALIYPGMVLKIPVSTTPIPPVETIFFRYPVNYIAISNPFSNTHYGVDLGYSNSILGPNQTIYAAMPGKILVASVDGGTAGTYIKLQYDDITNNCTWYNYYKHLSQLDVKAGDIVSLGQQIGIMGNTGNADGNHLHFDLIKVALGQSYDNNNIVQRAAYSVNPIDYLYVYKDQIVGDVTAANYSLKYM